MTGQQLAQLGFHVIPLYSIVDGACACREPDCASPGKHPCNVNGTGGATQDTGIIANWQKKHIGCNWGIVAGKPLPGGGFLYVADVDRRNFGDETIGELGGAVATRTAITSNGWHHYLRTPEPRATSKHLEGIDLIGVGNYVVAPGSRHFSGHVYAWDEGQPDFVADAPSWTTPPVRDEGPPIPVGPPPVGALARCAAYVAKMPPAVAGQGGDDLTFHVAQIITRKFALEGEEAWQIMIGWNARCRPPWKEHRLRYKLKSAKETGRMATLRDLDEPPHDADGVVLEEDARPTIRTDKEVYKTLDAVESALTARKDLFVRGNLLVQVVPRERPRKSERVSSEEGTPTVRTLPPQALRDMVSTVAKWEKFNDKTAEWEQCSVPPDPCMGLHHRGIWPKLRPLLGMVGTPILRADGTLAKDPGYDEATGYLLNTAGCCDITMATHADAVAAKGRLLHLVSDFPFQSDADRSAWLGMLMTLTTRAAFSGPVPMWTVTANVPGAGKSRLADLAAIIFTGFEASRSSLPDNEEEMGKSLTAIALEGPPLLLFDNISPGQAIGGGKLDAWLTGSRWKHRLLGTMANVDVAISTLLVATGNNLQIRGDTNRRVLPVRLESSEERPEDRTGFAIPDLLTHTREHRLDYACDLATIALAWASAGRPLPSGHHTWGSYEGWSKVVPPILQWIGLPNPLETRTELEDDDSFLIGQKVILSSWAKVETLLGVRTEGLTAREFVERTFGSAGKPKDGFEDIAAALDAVAPANKSLDPVDVKRFGYVLRSMKNRVIAGRKLVQAGNGGNHDKVARWTVRG